MSDTDEKLRDARAEVQRYKEESARRGNEVSRLLGECDRLQRELTTVNLERPLKLNYQGIVHERDQLKARLEILQAALIQTWTPEEFEAIGFAVRILEAYRANTNDVDEAVVADAAIALLKRFIAIDVPHGVPFLVRRCTALSAALKEALAHWDPNLVGPEWGDAKPRCEAVLKGEAG